MSLVEKLSSNKFLSCFIACLVSYSSSSSHSTHRERMVTNYVHLLT